MPKPGDLKQQSLYGISWFCGSEIQDRLSWEILLRAHSLRSFGCTQLVDGPVWRVVTSRGWCLGGSGWKQGSFERLTGALTCSLSNLSLRDPKGMF